MSYILSPKQNLKTLQKKMSQILERPVYIASCLYKSSGTHFKKPGDTHYQKISALDLFLSQWDSKCVKRETPEGNTDSYSDNYYFDLFPSNWLYLTFPYKKEESSLKLDDKFKIINIPRNLNPHSTIYCNEANVSDVELKKFIEINKFQNRNNYTSIKFLRSAAIEIPNINQKKWHLIEYEKFKTIQAPGQYNGIRTNCVYDYNRMAIVKDKPELCIVCRGSSGESIHLAPMYVGSSVYPMGHICRKCTKITFKQWQKFLDESPVDENVTNQK